MSRSMVAVALLLAVAGCSGDGGRSREPLPTASSPPASVPASAAPSASATATAPASEALDGCLLVDRDLVRTTLGADPGPGSSAPSDDGVDVPAGCTYLGELTVVVSVRTDPEAVPGGGTNFDALPGAEPVPGADAGVVVALPDGSSVVAELRVGSVLVNVLVKAEPAPATSAVQALAAAVVERLRAVS